MKDLERLRTNIVPAVGPLTARICFVGEAPGAEENSRLVPFVGSAGQLLDRCFKGAGILRSEVLLTNVFKQKPPKNDPKYYFEGYQRKLSWEGQEHLDALRGWLEGLLQRREETGEGPNVLVALGATALWALTGRRRINKWRGSVLPCSLVEGFKVYPMNHPSYVQRLMNEPEERIFGAKKLQKLNALPLFLSDLNRVKTQAEFPELLIPKRRFMTQGTLGEYLEQLRGLKGEKVVAVDIETLRSSTGPIVWCIGFSARPDWAFTIPIIKRGRLFWSEDEEREIWKEISRVFLDPEILKVFQNGGYDLSILGRYYGLRLAEGSYADTMWCHQATYPDLMKGLDTLASVYTWEPYYKDDGKWWDGRRVSDEAEFEYNARDCCVTREIWSGVSNEARVKQTWRNYQLHMKVFPSLLKMMIQGVFFDESSRQSLLFDFEEKIAAALVKIEEEVGTGFNINSPSQLQRLLYGMLGLKIQYNHKTKKPTTDKDALNKLKRLYPEQEVLQAILDFRTYEKLRGTYGEMKADVDNRIRTNYGWISTFRLSSSESHFGNGGNLQNIPARTEEGKLVRKLFIPDPGKCFIASDLSQAEAREVAWLAGDEELIELFLHGYDVHWEEARRIFGIPEALRYDPDRTFFCPLVGEDRTLKELRNIAKSVVHATNYGMGPGMLQTILSRVGVFISLNQAKGLLGAAARARPMKGQWQNSIRQEIRLHRTLVTPLGDRREFRGRINDNLFRAAYAFIPQSTVGRLLQLAIQNIHTNLSYFDCLLNVHDEVVGQLSPEDVPRALVELKPLMEIPHEVGGRELIIPADFKVGWSWGELHEVKTVDEAMEVLREGRPN